MEFDAAHEGWTAYLPKCLGYIILDNSEYSIPELFYEWILPRYRDCPGLGCPTYYASDTHYVTVEVNPDEDLIIGGKMMDCDVWTPDDRLFDGGRAWRASEIVPGEYTIINRSITLVVRIEEISGP
ncbi:hypothetical protein ACFLV7_08515 [Chloroflexota bacterium]